MRKILTALFLMIAPVLSAEEVTSGDLTISDAHSYATPAKAGAAYMTITNAGDTADRLTGAQVDFADAQLHESKTDAEGVMRMEHLMNGIAIPAGETVTLARGGLHVMMMGLTPSPARAGRRSAPSPAGGSASTQVWPVA